MPNLQGYRTLIVSALTALVAVASFIAQVAADVGPLDQQTSVSMLLLAIVMAVLRLVTKTPPGSAP